VTAYLFVWATLTFIAAGALCWLVLDHALGARWSIGVRSSAELVAAALVPLALLFVPLAIAAPYVWPWVDPSPALAAAIAPKRAWLSLPFFLGRSSLYFISWIATLAILRRRRSRSFALAMLLPIGLVTSFAANDWLMTLWPTWTSSAFGMYVLTGAVTGGLAATLVVSWLRRRSLAISADDCGALGRVLLVFVLTWGYLAYMQGFLIQIANRPDEVDYYVARTTGAWRIVTALLVALHLAIPMPLLVPRRFKRRLGFLAAVAALLLAARVIDTLWMVVPR
jgi:hypothetical protein